MISNHFFNLIECYSEQGRCLFMGYELFGYASNLLPLICWIVFSIYIIGFICQVRYRCLCCCGEPMFNIGSLIGLIYVLFWFILVPLEFIWNVISNYSFHDNNEGVKK